jgi:hypothetical protein
MSDPANLPPKLDEEPRSSRHNWWSRLPGWGQWALGILAVVILLGIGAAIGGSGNKESELKDEIAALEGQVQQAEGTAKRAEAAEDETIQTGEEKAAQIVVSSEAKAQKILGAAGNESEQLTDKISAQEGELESLEGKASSTESKIENLRGEEGEAEEVAAKSEITDGVWQAERDYIPGTYESPGGGGCYWALLSDVGGGLESIIENGGFNKHQILEITSPFFETNGCGTWKRVE